MRWYEVFCSQCGYSSKGYTAEQIRDGAVTQHRCRICLMLDPASSKKFEVRETITAGGPLIRGGENGN